MLRMESWRLPWQWVVMVTLSTVLVGCGSLSKPITSTSDEPLPAVRVKAKGIPALPAAGSGRGGYYLDDGPSDNIPDGLYDVPDAVPKIEPYARAANRPYVVFGQTYTPITDNRPYKQRGYGSWYGKKFHGRKTSSGEPYDMFKMTAAHPTLPIPCYARVTNLGNGKQVIVRVNDRGPFRSARIIDLSYTAALKLGYLSKGSGQLEVEHLLPDEIKRLAQSGRQGGDERAAASSAQQSESAKEGERNDAQSGDFLDSFLANARPEKTAGMADAAMGYYLQLGVYRKAGNARSMQAKYAQEWRNEISGFEVVSSGRYYKLFAGPFSNLESASDVARRFGKTTGVNPLIVQR